MKLYKCYIRSNGYRSFDEIIEVLFYGVNDRISFKRFLGLPLDRPSPLRAGALPSGMESLQDGIEPEADHSTFSRFRSRLGKWALMKINSACPVK